MSAASSSMGKTSNHKPLDPFAKSYQPQGPQPLNIYFPPESPYYFHCHPPPSFHYLNIYNSGKQPLPWIEVFNAPKHINYGSERIVGNRNKSKWRLLPPRLKSAKEFPMHRQEVWVKKVKAGLNHAEEQAKFDGKTSLMIKNVPNHFQRIDLQRVLDDHCGTENRKAQPGSYFCKSEYDFLYLPMDFGFHLNLGFAFVNFTSPVAALRFYKDFNNREWSSRLGRKKICEISVAKFQGKDALKENFEHSYFACHTNKYLPVVYTPPRDGFNRSNPTVVGRRIHVTATPKDQKVMIMTQRKNKKEA
ncbi:protein terminal ear1-like protein [Gossypium australe]|uniref:Protein terminal ear1-like protein n=1 Tax=Gossypium australe TaxID=47621 RepID=A0A5B6WBH2_9ROSI|nr:protein terminal ear1-like protein [Gossypium australe]